MNNLEAEGKFRVLPRVQWRRVQRPHLRRESVASVTTGTDDLWDELVLDSGSVSTACPYAWCSDISVNDGDKVYLQDIQQRRIPLHGSRVVPLQLWGQGRTC